MIIDLHTHTFPDKIAAATVEKLAQAAHIHPFTDGSLAGLAASTRRAGIDYSVVLPVATNTRQVVKVNDISIRLNQSGGPILSFGCMHPDFPDWKTELSRIAGEGIRGIKIHPAYQQVRMDDPRYLRIMDRCGELGLAVLAHAGLDVGLPEDDNCSPSASLSAIRQVGPVKLILAHMGGWRNWDEVEELLVDTPVYLDTSFSLGSMRNYKDNYYSPEQLRMLGEEQFVRMVRAFGARRIFFGTDSPWGGQEEDLALFRALPLTDEEKAAILGGNAAKLLGLAQ